MTTRRYDAVVTDNNDDQLRGRIKVACAGLLGDEDAPLPDWVEPNLPWGWFVVPDVGETVEIELQEGEDHDEVYGASSIDAPNVRWTGKRAWTVDEPESGEARPIHDDMKVNYGKRRGFITPNGHILYFDDTENKQKVQLTWKKGDEYQFMSFDEKGSTILQNINGTTIFMDAENKAFTIIDENSNTIQMGPDGIKLVDLHGNVLQMTNSLAQFMVSGNMNILGNACDIKTGTVNLLDGATSPIIRGDIMVTVHDPHQHPGPFGLTGPPTVLMASTPGVLSANAKVGA